MTIRERVRHSAQRWVFQPVRTFVGNCLSVLDEFVDWYYFRFDLWLEAPRYADETDHINYGKKQTRGRADYAKVRGHLAFWLVVAMDVWVFEDTKQMPAVVALLAPIALLAYSLSERVFIAFLKVLPQVISGWRGPALAGSVVKEIEERRASVGGDHEPTGN